MPTVLLVSHHYPPHIGGLGLVVQKQAQSLDEDGYQVIVLTSRYGQIRDRDRERTGIRIEGIPCSHILERVCNIPFPLFSPSLLWRGWRLIRRADVVHIHDVFYLSSWVTGALALLLRKPLLVTQHVALVDHSSKLVMRVQRLVYATVGRWLFLRARKVVVYNQNVQSFLLTLGVPPERILFMANGIDTAAFHPATPEERAAIRQRFALPQGRPLVLFVGRLVEKKGYQVLLAARDPAYDLVFVGPGPVPKDGRIQTVHWLGPLDQDQTAQVCRACDLFAFPAIGEIFTLVMQEAMASGLPVVTTDDPAYPGSMVAGCVTLARRDADSFREAIARTLSDPSVLRELGAQSREVAVRNFDWCRNFRALEAVYAQIAGNPAHPQHAD
jgi:glycosyltransferase involved in cell wall biosynthesis